jgi:hypothetical protein
MQNGKSQPSLNILCARSSKQEYEPCIYAWEPNPWEPNKAKQKQIKQKEERIINMIKEKKQKRKNNNIDI